MDDWLPLHAWTTEQVWQRIKASGVRYHPAYDLGMPRLSCCFCIFSPRSALLLAGKHNPELLAEYVAVEKQIGHRFRKELSLTEVQEALAKGEPARSGLTIGSLKALVELAGNSELAANLNRRAYAQSALRSTPYPFWRNGSCRRSVS